MSVTISPQGFRAWARLCADALASARAEIDALNVFPVPDSDTGTNSYFTFEAGAAALADLPANTKVSKLMKSYGDGLLMGARGNSGVILSELVRGSLRLLRKRRHVSSDDVVEAFLAAASAAYAAVGEPVEGTILSVAGAAAKGAQSAAEDGQSAVEVFEAAANAAREALTLTPTQMERLARSGVVDAGGRALVVVLDATLQALTGKLPPPAETFTPVPFEVTGDDLDENGPAYEVMYLLDAKDSAISALRERLSALGDSLVVVGSERLWNVHVHVDDVGAAIEAGLDAGRPYRIAVTHFAEQITRQRRVRRQRAVVAAVTGSGLARITREIGAVPMEFGPRRRLSLSEMATAIKDLDADEVIVLPNREAHIHQFEAAAHLARSSGARVAVIPTSVQVQGLVALAVHDPGRAFDDDVIAMSTAAGHVKHGAVTVATEAGMTMAGPCDKGDVLGVVNGDFAIVGARQTDVALEVLQRLDSQSAEMVTLVRGADCLPSDVEVIEDFLRDVQPHVDVVTYDGAQDKYSLFIAVE